MTATFDNEDKEFVDDFAKAGGWLTAIFSWLTGFYAPVEMLTPAALITPGEQEALMRIVVACIGGCFGLAGTALAVLLKHWLDVRKKRRERETE